MRRRWRRRVVWRMVDDERWGRAAVGSGRERTMGGGSRGNGRFGRLGWLGSPGRWGLAKWWVEIGFVIGRMVGCRVGREAGLGVAAASPWCSSSS